MNMGSSTGLRFGSIMGTDLDAALDEIYYGRHCRLNGGIPVSLGARTSYDIRYAHQRLLKRQEADRVEKARLAKSRKKRAKEAKERAHAKEQWALRQAHQAQATAQVTIFERRRGEAANEVSLWQEEGWTPWWELLRLAARKRAIQQADYNETGAGADSVRYLLLQTHLKELALEHGFSEKTAKAVAAAIFVRGFASWSLGGTE